MRQVLQPEQAAAAQSAASSSTRAISQCNHCRQGRYRDHQSPSTPASSASHPTRMTGSCTPKSMKSAAQVSNRMMVNGPALCGTRLRRAAGTQAATASNAPQQRAAP